MLTVPLSPCLVPAIFLLARLCSLPLSRTLWCLLALLFLVFPLPSPFLGLNHEALNYEPRRHEIMPAVNVPNEPFRSHCSCDLVYLFG